MESHEVRAVEMTRRVRAEHAEQLRGATPEERIRFYREKAGWTERQRPIEEPREPLSEKTPS